MITCALPPVSLTDTRDSNFIVDWVAIDCGGEGLAKGSQDWVPVVLEKKMLSEGQWGDKNGPTHAKYIDPMIRIALDPVISVALVRVVGTIRVVVGTIRVAIRMLEVVFPFIEGF